MTATASGARERIDMPSAIVTPDPFDTRRLLPDRPFLCCQNAVFLLLLSFFLFAPVAGF